MLSCKDISHLASDHIDQNLPFFMKMKVKMHLSMCNNCRNFIKQFEITVNAIKHVKPSPIDAGGADSSAIDRQVQVLLKAHLKTEQQTKSGRNNN